MIPASSIITVYLKFQRQLEKCTGLCTGIHMCKTFKWFTVRVRETVTLTM